VMDPLEKLDLQWDTSLHLLGKLKRLGHETYSFTLPRIFLSSGRVKGRDSGIGKEWDLSEFDVVFIRKDPPFDSSYLALTYLLEPAAQKTVVINHPRGIRNANEKLFGLRFPRWSPPTIVSADPYEIIDFQKQIRSPLVIKPLYEKGGRGVFLFNPHPHPLPSRGEGRVRGAALRRLKRATRNGNFVVAQKFIPVPKGGGDKRILVWKGEILGGFERIPPPGEFRSNLSLGGKFRECRITGEDKRLVRSLRPALLKEGLLFAGIDIRGGFLLEVNVTSPAGLVELDQLYGGATQKMAEDLAGISQMG